MRVPSNFSISMSDRYCESKIHHEIDMSMLRLVETSVVMDGIVQIDEISIQTIKQGFSITNMTYFLIGCFFLAIKIFWASLVCPLTVNLPPPNFLVKAIWRTMGNSILSSVLMIIIYYWNRRRMSFIKDHSLKAIIHSMKISFCSFGWFVCFSVGGCMIVSSHAHAIYTNTAAYICFFSIVYNKIVHKYEFFGFWLFFLGIIVLILDQDAVKIRPMNNKILGILICMLGTGFGALNSYLSQKAQIKVHPFLMIVHTSIFSTIYQFIFLIMVSGPSVISTEPRVGIFGWMKELRYICIVIFGLIPFTTMLGNMSFIISLKYIRPEIASVGVLLEPFFSQFIAVYMGIDPYPGFLTILGLLVIIWGSLFTITGTKLRVEEEIRKLEEQNQFMINISPVQHIHSNNK